MALWDRRQRPPLLATSALPQLSAHFRAHAHNPQHRKPNLLRLPIRSTVAMKSASCGFTAGDASTAAVPPAHSSTPLQTAEAVELSMMYRRYADMYICTFAAVLSCSAVLRTSADALSNHCDIGHVIVTMRVPVSVVFPARRPRPRPVSVWATHTHPSFLLNCLLLDLRTRCRSTSRTLCAFSCRPCRVV